MLLQSRFGILQAVASYLTKSEIFVCLQVCKEFHAILHPILWKNLDLDEHFVRNPVLFQYAPLIQLIHFSFDEGEDWRNNFLLRLCEKFTNLQQLAITSNNCNEVFHLVTKALVTIKPTPKSFVLDYTNVGYCQPKCELSDLSEMKKLRTLKIFLADFCDKRDMDFAVTFILQQGELEELDLAKVALSEENFNQILTQNCYLKSLSLDSIPKTENFKNLKIPKERAAKLEVLRLQNMPLEDTSKLGLFNSFRALREIALTGVDITNEDLKLLPKSCNSLKIMNCGLVTALGILDVVEQLSLKELAFSNKDPNLHLLLDSPGMQHLTYLSLNFNQVSF